MLFDYKFYVSHYKDINNFSFLEACNHFINIGIKEKRIFNDKLLNFDYDFYIEYYKDLKNLTYLEACNHYIKYGKNEKRYNNIINHINFKNVISTKYDKINNNYKFIHITKTGGTSIEEFGIKLGIKWGKYDKIFYDNFKTDEYWHTPLCYFDIEIIKRYKWFCIVRNPYDRILSELNFLVKANFIKHNREDINLYLKNILQNILIENKLNKEFIEDNKLCYKFHFVPQYFYISNEINTNNFKIIKFENLNKEVNNFFREIKIEENFNIHENKSEKYFSIENLTIQNIKLINKIYKKDFELFNYKLINMSLI